MTDKNILNDNELQEVTGGSVSTSTPRFQVGDKVSLIVYPEFGVGVVQKVYMSGGIWKCLVKFDAGLIDTSDIEFIPA